MTTSSTYTVTVNAEKMAKAISRIVWGEPDPQPERLDEIIEAINFWLFQAKEPKSAISPGDFLWQRETTDITLSSKISYDLKPSGGDADIQIPLEIITANLKDTDDNETPMSDMDLFEFQSITNKTSTGTPQRYYYERRLDTGKLYLDVVPADTTDVIDIVYLQPFEVITATTQTFDIDSNFYRLMKYDIALDMAPESRMDGETFNMAMSRRNEAKAIVDSVSPENSNEYFEPELY